MKEKKIFISLKYDVGGVIISKLLNIKFHYTIFYLELIYDISLSKNVLCYVAHTRLLWVLLKIDQTFKNLLSLNLMALESCSLIICTYNVFCKWL